jgi:hypothetical protein
MFIIELPIFLLYLRARGLNDKYWAMFRVAPKGSPDAAWASASVKSVEKQLNDTRWDGLRTASGKRVLLWGSNIMILFGTGYLWLVGDSGWAAYSLIHILLIFVFGFLLRQSVRLVADAPEEALDEMLIQLRDRSYFVAYRWLCPCISRCIMAYSFAVIFKMVLLQLPAGLHLEFKLWLIGAYVFMMPSMAMIAVQLKREKGRV